jgi:hypothetical protein
MSDPNYREHEGEYHHYQQDESQPFALPANPKHEKQLRDQIARSLHPPPIPSPNSHQQKDMKAPTSNDE